MQLGILAVLEPNEFVNPTIDILDYVDKGTVERLDPSRGFDWRIITHAVRRRREFTVESDAPEFKATLRFAPESPASGFYDIHFKPRGPREIGTTWKISPVEADQKHRYLAGMKVFPFRYVVVTAANDRARYHRVWLIGLSDLPIGE